MAIFQKTITTDTTFKEFLHELEQKIETLATDIVELKGIIEADTSTNASNDSPHKLVVEVTSPKVLASIGDSEVEITYKRNRFQVTRRVVSLKKLIGMSDIKAVDILSLRFYSYVEADADRTLEWAVKEEGLCTLMDWT